MLLNVPSQVSMIALVMTIFYHHVFVSKPKCDFLADQILEIRFIILDESCASVRVTRKNSISDGLFLLV